jgi:hypothetical protein
LWRTEISIAHRTIKAKYRYDHTHDTNFIKDILKVLTGSDEARDCHKANPTGCKYCAKHDGNGYAHAVPKNIPHDKCNVNPKFKGWRPKWVCDRLEIAHKDWDKSYRVLMTRLQQAGIVPKKHILDKEVSEAMKTIIKDKYKMAMDRLSPKEPSGSRNLKFQGPFLECIGRCGRGFSAFIMGPPLPTDRNNTQFVAAIQCYTNGLSLCTLVWTV